MKLIFKDSTGKETVIELFDTTAALISAKEDLLDKYEDICEYLSFK